MGRFVPPLQVVGGNKAGHPTERHAIDPDTSWKSLVAMAGTVV
jgi:hypothetical protein